MSTVASYPHVQIGVKDKSIYIPIATEDLPLHKPLYMMKCEKGPVGVPVWCPSYTDAKKRFGIETFNKRSDYFSEQAYFLLQTFQYNGAFIMRVCDSLAKPSEVSIELGVSKSEVDVPLWQRDANGRFVLELDGSKIPIDEDGEVCKYLYTYTPVTAGSTFDTAKTYYRQNISGTAYITVDTSNWGTTVPNDGKQYYLCSDANVPMYAKATETVALAGRQYFTRTSNFEYFPVIPTDRRTLNISYYKGMGKINLVANATGDALYALTTDTKFVAGKTYYTKPTGGGLVPTTYPAATVTTGETVTANTYYELKGPDSNKIYFLIQEKGENLTNSATGVEILSGDVVKQYNSTTKVYDVVDIDADEGGWAKDTDTGTYTVPATGKFVRVSATGSVVLKVKPCFGLKTWADGDTVKAPADFLVLDKFERYDLAAEGVLPVIQAGNVFGDRFDCDEEGDSRKIVADAFCVVANGSAGYTTDATCVNTYVFTSARAAVPYTYTSVPLAAGTSLSNGTFYYLVGYSLGSVNRVAQQTVKGRKLVWRSIIRDAATDPREFGSAETKDSENFTWYPMFDIVADNPGEWGKAFGFKFYYDKTKNTLNTTIANKAITISMSPQQLVKGDTTPTSIVDAYASDTVTGVIRPDVVDAMTDLDMTLGKRADRAYTGNYALPCTIHYYPGNFEIIGKLLMAAEIKQRKALESFYSVEGSALEVIKDDFDESLGLQTFVDRLLDKTATEEDLNDTEALYGYMANVLSCVDSDNIPYFTSCIVNGDDALVQDDGMLSAYLKKSVFVPTSETVVYLQGGSDGEKNDWDIERFIRAQITAAENNTQEYLIDYMRCPYNSIVDTGVSLATKKSYIDFMGVRDNMVINLSTQSTWKYKVNDEVMTPAANERMDDESIGASLRSYAWLMREDIANGTEACRCNIFLHAGKTSDHEGWVPETLWIAIKKASYLNLDYINKEAKELPNSSVDCFTELSWVAASEDTKSRCWNNGLNYVQYYNMTKVHHASVRTVYRYDTSILSDAGVTDALTFMKDHIRQSWARWAGSTRKAAELNARITEDLNKRYQYMLNGKYDFSVKVYQTDEDVKLGYVRHVDVELIAPGQNRVWLATVICKREGYEPEE